LEKQCFSAPVFIEKQTTRPLKQTQPPLPWKPRGKFYFKWVYASIHKRMQETPNL